VNSAELFDIPDDLAARARAVPGLPQRLVHFLHMEVAQYEERRKRYRPETLAIAQRAREKAERRKAEGFDRTQAMAGFERRHHALIGESES